MEDDSVYEFSIYNYNDKIRNRTENTRRIIMTTNAPRKRPSKEWIEKQKQIPSPPPPPPPADEHESNCKCCSACPRILKKS